MFLDLPCPYKLFSEMNQQSLFLFLFFAYSNCQKETSENVIHTKFIVIKKFIYSDLCFEEGTTLQWHAILSASAK